MTANAAAVLTTTARRLAARFADHCCFADEQGTLDEALAVLAVSRDVNETGEVAIYVFADGSDMTVYGDAWWEV